MDDFRTLLMGSIDDPSPTPISAPPPIYTGVSFPTSVTDSPPTSASAQPFVSASLPPLTPGLDEGTGDPTIEFVPSVGMEFDTLKASEEFWKRYAFETGFGVRVFSSNSKDDIVTSKVYVCSKQGQKAEDKRRVNAKPRADRRCNCGVLMRIWLSRDTGKYVVKEFVERHNHDLEGKETIHNLRSHKSISERQAHEIDMARRAGLGPKMTHRHMAIQAGGSENLSFTKAHLNSYLQTEKRLKKLELGEAGAILEYFQEKTKKNPSFFHAYQVDDGGKITNVFWADPNMLADYEIFGDVTSFDTTFGTNKASRPLGVFSGFNNHRQIVIFGGCLLYDESADSFIWLFKKFLSCHRGKLPRVVFTDQDAAMKVALSKVMPTVKHALCIWHIGQNALRKVNPDILGDINLFMIEFYYCVNEIFDVDEFVVYWRDMAERYGLTQNPWLQGIYALRNQVSIAFMNALFTGGARSTQMSESINANLKRDLGSGLTMPSFFNGFDLCLADVRQKESDSDFYSRQTFPHLKNEFCSLLKQASRIYTPKMFKLFNEQFDLDRNISLDKYDIVDYPHVIMATDGDRSYKINYDPSSMTISCTCCMFERCGYLCSHILRVFNLRHVQEIPTRYILKRWTRNAKSNYDVVVNYSPGLSKAQQIDILDSHCRRAIHRVIGDDELFEGFLRTINSYHSVIDDHHTSKGKGEETISRSSFEHINIQNGVVVTGLKKKDNQKRSGSHRKISCTEGNKKSKKVRAMQQRTSKLQVARNEKNITDLTL